MAKTLYDKIWDAHLVNETPGESPVLYIDRHLVHEVTSPQAFEGLRHAGRKVRRPEATLAVPDHNVPTIGRSMGNSDPESRIQVATLEANAKEFGVEYLPLPDIRQGIVHIVGPEQGFTLPGMTIVCGDSHTSTHGAFGSLAFGHRHLRRRACAGDPDAPDRQVEEHAHHGERRIAARRHRQGHRTRHHRQDRHRRRHRLCHRI